MRYPMLNPRKPAGHRGENAVQAMRAQRIAEGKALPPSDLHISPTGTVALKNFRGAGAPYQPTRPVPFMGGLVPFNFGD